MQRTSGGIALNLSIRCSYPLASTVIHWACRLGFLCADERQRYDVPRFFFLTLLHAEVYLRAFSAEELCLRHAWKVSCGGRPRLLCICGPEFLVVATLPT